MSPPGGPADRAVEDVARSSYGRLVAYLASLTGDLQAAEDALGDALLAALRSWPEHGVPERPESWLVTAARRRIVDAARRRDTAARNLPDLALLQAEQQDDPAPAAVADKRLELLFACAHPIVAEPMRSPLMLQTVLGLDAARIASAFLVAPSTMGQRLVRAKERIRRAGVPFRLPDEAQLPERLESVLDAVYAAYGTGWDDPAGLDPGRQGLTAEALRLAELLTDVLPDEPETRGLYALLLHLEARAGARRSADGDFVPLLEQDTGLWSADRLTLAEQHLRTALAAGHPGPYQVQAAIQSVHNLRAATGRTDWAAIAQLYDALVVLAPSTGAQVARAAAHRACTGPAAALDLLEVLPAAQVREYQPYWVLRAHCLHDLDRTADAQHAARLAVGLTADPAVRDHLRTTLPT